MDERLRFIARLLEGEKMAPVCREFGISRVPGYEIFERYKACGLDGLHDRGRAPYRQANKLPFQVERAILGIKFVGVHAAVSNLFNLGRHLIAAAHYRTLRQGAFASWDRAVVM